MSAVGSAGSKRLPSEVRSAVERYLAAVDRALPGRVTGFYVVGSTALGAFRPGRSDVDFVAVTGGLTTRDLGVLRGVQRRVYRGDLARDLRWPLRWPLVCNGVFVREDDVARQPTDITPVASHVSGHFEAGSGFDVNPVTWKTLSEHGIALRGAGIDELGIHIDSSLLRSWTIGNLNTYWKQWACGARRRGPAALRAGAFHLSTAWGALGAPRLHCTVATGRIISKEQAGEYACDTFDPAWHPLVREALEYWRGESRGGTFRPALRQRRAVGDFVEMVVESANEIGVR